jgi:hypothetical protein
VTWVLASLALAACGSTKKPPGVDGSPSPDTSADDASGDGASCPGNAPVVCEPGGPSGTGVACGTLLMPDVCIGGGWVCAAGTVDVSACTCIGPGAAGCTCTAQGWTCPDAGADAAGDAKPAADGPIDQAVAACAFSATYTFHDDGGLRAFVDSSTLSPQRTHQITRTPAGNGQPTTCSRQLPCESATAASVSAIEAAIASSDVRDALAGPVGMLYGTDPRPFDGSVLTFQRGSRGFAIGNGAVPTGLRVLEGLLHQAQAETLASPECAALAP